MADYGMAMEEEEEEQEENNTLFFVDDSDDNDEIEQELKDYSIWATNKHLIHLETNKYVAQQSFEDFVKPYLLSRKQFAKKYNAIPQSMILRINRWPNQGLCISLSFLSKDNDNVLDLIWNPPKDNVIRVLTQRVKYSPNDQIITCNVPTNGNLYDTGVMYIIDWMQLIKPMSKSFRIMVSYRSHASQDEPVSASLQPIGIEDNTVLWNLFKMSTQAETAAKNWFTRTMGLESIYLDVGQVLLPNLFSHIKPCVANRIFSKQESPNMAGDNQRLNEITILSKSIFVYYFLDLPINTVPTTNRILLRNQHKKGSARPRVSQNDLDNMRGKTYKQRGYVYFDISPSVDGKFYPSKEPEKIIRLKI